QHTAPPETYALSLHDALPISAVRLGRPASFRVPARGGGGRGVGAARGRRHPGALPAAVAAGTHRAAEARHARSPAATAAGRAPRSEEHTSELQSRENLVCRLL